MAEQNVNNRITKTIPSDSRGTVEVVDEAVDGSKAIPVVFVTKKAAGGFGYDGKPDPTTELDNDIKSPISRDATDIAAVVDEDIDGKKAIPLVVYTKNDEGKLVPAELSTGSGGGGGDFDGTIPWSSVTDKPQTYPPTEHDHDNRYYRKDEIDSPEFLVSRVDRETVDIEQGELKAKKLVGLQPDVQQLNTWLNGTEKNLQVQIDDLKLTLAALSAGMRYRGKFETHAELQGINNKDGGDLAVVLADESRGGVRSMYVYNEILGMWDFIGAFEFSDAFTALTDTPNGYDDGKVLRSGAVGLFYDVVRWAEIANKPSSTITQIDDAVAKRHEHPDLGSLNRIGIDGQGRMTIDGVPYIPTVKKQRLYARRTGAEQALEAGTTCIFNTKHDGDIPYNTTTGIFTLEAGKTYRVFVTASFKTTGFVILHLVDAETNTVTADSNRAIWMDVNLESSNWHESSAGPLLAYVTPTVTKDYKINVASQSGTASLRNNFSALEIQEI